MKSKPLLTPFFTRKFTSRPPIYITHCSQRKTNSTILHNPFLLLNYFSPFSLRNLILHLSQQTLLWILNQLFINPKTTVPSSFTLQAMIPLVTLTLTNFFMLTFVSTMMMITAKLFSKISTCPCKTKSLLL